MSRTITLRDCLDEIIPALSAAGLSSETIREISRETQRRMGPGGTISEWLRAMGEVVGGYGEMPRRAYLLALDAIGKRPLSEGSDD